VREEAGELCQTLEAGEGAERAASEMADLLYHSMVLLNLQVGVFSAGVGAGGWVGFPGIVQRIAWLRARRLQPLAPPTRARP
jgi:phosphoribosyl-ATP pyrophosphohydrolase/phosphoribosyl-AMP cyclohydrolase